MSITFTPADFDAFRASNPEFDLIEFDFHDAAAVGALQLANGDESLAGVKALQRVARITQDEAQAFELLQRNVHSAYQVASMPVKTFTTVSALDATTARAVHARARTRKRQALFRFMELRDNTGAHYSAGRFSNLRSHADASGTGIPTYADFFGGLDYCDCEDCRTVFSPEAYYVDLRNAVHRFVQGTPPERFALGERRPDLDQLVLDQKNTDALVPYISLVNTVLEARYRAGADASADVYEELSQAVFPFNMPFHLPLRRIDLAFEKLGVSRALWYETFAPDPDPGVFAVQYFKMSEAEADIIGMSRSGDLERLAPYYGFDSGENLNGVLGDVKTFLRRTGLTRDELDELLRQGVSDEEWESEATRNFFINRSANAALRFLQIQVDPQTDAEILRRDDQSWRSSQLPNGWDLHRLNAFIRLARRIDWSFADLDLALMQGGAAEPSRAGLAVLAKLDSLRERLGLSMEELVSLYKNLPDLRAGETGKTFYRRVFPESLEGATWNPNDAAGPLAPALIGSLGVTGDQLSPVGRACFPDENAVTLDNEKLSLLYRTAKIPAILGIDLQSFLVLRDRLLPAEENETDLDYLLRLLHSTDTLREHGWGIHEIDFVLNGRSNDSAGDATIAAVPVLTDVRLTNFLQELHAALPHTATLYRNLDFDGQSTHVRVPGIPAVDELTDALTVSAWIYPASISSGDVRRCIVENRSEYRPEGAATYLRTNLIFAVTDDNLFFAGHAGESSITAQSHQGAIVPDRWQYVTAVFRRASPENGDGFLKLYVNGTEVHHKPVSTNPLHSPTEPHDLLIGRPSAGSANAQNFHGFLRDVRIWNRALTADEIAANQSGQNAGTDGSLVAHWPLDEGTGTTIENRASGDTPNNGAVHGPGEWIRPEIGAEIATASQNQLEILSEEAARLLNFQKSDAAKILERIIKTGYLLPAGSRPETDVLVPALEAVAATNADPSVALAVPSGLSEYLDGLQRALILTRRIDFTAFELETLIQHPEFFGLAGQVPASIAEVLHLHRFQDIKIAFGDGSNDLLREYFPGAATRSDAATILGDISGQDAGELETLMAHFWPDDSQTDGGYRDLPGLARIQSALTFARKTGGPVATLVNFWNKLWATGATPTYAETSATADAVFEWLRGKYSESAWRENLPLLNRELDRQRRDALLPETLFRLQDANIQIETTRDLYDYLLIDVEMGETLETSPVKQAISTLQAYIQRIHMGLESGLSLEDSFERWWNWIKNYRVWEVNRKIFLYPENYIRPELMSARWKTPLFRGLEEELLQDEITPATVHGAFRNYLNGFEEIAEQRNVGSYMYEGPEGGQRTLVLFGRGRDEDRGYYMRKAVFAYDVEANRYVPVEWGAYQEVKTKIKADRVAPVLAFGRLFLFWVETRSISGGSVDSEEEIQVTEARISTKKSYEATIRFSYQDFRDEWVQARTAWSEISIADLSEESLKVYPLWEAERNQIVLLYGEPELEEDAWRISERGVTLTMDANLNTQEREDTVFQTTPNANLYTLSAETIPTRVRDIIHDTAFGGNLFGGDLNPLASYPLTNNPKDQTGNGFDAIPREIIRISTGSYWFAKGHFDLPIFEELNGSFSITARILPLIVLNYIPGGVLPIVTQQTDQSGQNRHTHFNLCLRIDEVKFFMGNGSSHTQAVLPFQNQSRPRFVAATFDANTKEMALYLDDLEPHRITHSGSVQPGNTVHPVQIGRFTGWTQTFAGTIQDVRIFDHALDATSIAALRNDERLFTDTPRGTRAFAVGNAPGWNIVETGGDAFLLAPRNNFGTITAGLGRDQEQRFTCAPGEGDNPEGGQKWDIHRLSSRVPETMQAKLFTGGVGDILSPDTQTAAEKSLADFGPRDAYISRAPSDRLDFHGPLGQYFREIFFHAPLLVAGALQNERRYEDAREWYQYIFNPTFTAPDGNTQSDQDPGRYWRYLPLRDLQVSDLRDANASALAAYETNPFDPFAIAELRPVAYQKAVVMRTIENLLEWGDHEFRKDTRESINEAIILYMRAYDLLGNRPRALGSCDLPEPVAFPALNGTAGEPGAIDPARPSPAGMMMELENGTYSVPATGGNDTPNNSIVGNYFGIPENVYFLDYWNRVEDRLYKIRRGLNIEGAERRLALFQPAIDPFDFLRRLAAGESLDRALEQMSAAVPHYRFAVMLERAKAMTNSAMQLGAALLSALEKQDAEELDLLRATHEKTIQELTLGVREDQVAEAEAALEGLRFALDGARTRRTHYAKLIQNGLNSNEKGEVRAMIDSMAFSAVASLTESAASIAFQGPQFGSFFSLNYGGKQWGAMLTALAGSFRARAGISSSSASLLATKAGFQRRAEDWALQERLAEHDERQIQAQLSGAEIQVKIAEQEVRTLEKSIEQDDEFIAFLEDKFTNKELYRWMVSRLSGLYFQVYRLALDIGLAAEKAYQFERTSSDTFITPGAWNGLRKGLLAGETLQLSLARMEKSYLDQNARRLEIQKTISLAQLKPEALLDLKRTGSCTFELNEADFALDHPDHYCRQIKSLSISFPAVLGPYQNINAKLTQTLHRTLITPDPEGVRFLLTGTGEVPGPNVLRQDWRPNQQVALSRGLDDSGLFEVNFGDERYLPFEGTGAISSWRLDLPLATNRFNRESLTDVIIQLHYTALPGGRTIYDAVKNDLTRATGQRLFSMAGEFPDAWHRFLHPQSASTQSLEFKMDPRYFPSNLGELQVEQLVLALEPAASTSVPDQFAIQLGSGSGPTETVSLTPDERGLLVGTFNASQSSFDGSWTLSVTADGGSPSGGIRNPDGFLDESTVKNLWIAAEFSGTIQWD